MPAIKNKPSGFTLVEILVVIALIAILAAITIIAINPAKNFADTRNVQRSADVSLILSAITEYTSQQGAQLSDLGSIPLCSASHAAIGSGNGNVNLATKLVPDPLVAMPQDPSTGTDANTGYTICTTAASAGKVQIAAPAAENGKTIMVQR